MVIGKQWLDQLYHRQLKKQLTQQSFKRTPVEYRQAKSIGILLDATKPENIGVIKKIVHIHTTHNRKVKVLAYFNDKEEHPNFPYDYFGKKDVSIISKPKGRIVKQFIDQPFDVLFNLCLTDNLMLAYISALSKAHIRVGPYQEKIDCYDLMIDIPKGKGINYFIQQAEKILDNIKSDQYEVSKS